MRTRKNQVRRTPATMLVLRLGTVALRQREAIFERDDPMRFRHLVAVVLLLLPWSPVLGGDKQAAPKTENVIVVTLDGFRWQDFFGGADESLLHKQFGGVPDVAGLKQRYWRETPEERRKVLLPFFWGTIAKQGQIFGDHTKKAPARLTNGLKFSYPGYSEMFCGIADPRIDSNAKKPNPNLSVLEFLNGKSAYR